MTLLDQLHDSLPGIHHQQRVYWSADVEEATRIATQVRELNIKSLRFVLRLERFEPRPPENSPRREAYDILVASLTEVVPRLTMMPAIAELMLTERDGD